MCLRVYWGLFKCCFRYLRLCLQANKVTTPRNYFNSRTWRLTQLLDVKLSPVRIRDEVKSKLKKFNNNPDLFIATTWYVSFTRLDY